MKRQNKVLTLLCELRKPPISDNSLILCTRTAFLHLEQLAYYLMSAQQITELVYCILPGLLWSVITYFRLTGTLEVVRSVDIVDKLQKLEMI